MTSRQEDTSFKKSTIDRPYEHRGLVVRLTVVIAWFTYDKRAEYT